MIGGKMKQKVVVVFVILFCLIACSGGKRANLEINLTEEFITLIRAFEDPDSERRRIVDTIINPRVSRNDPHELNNFKPNRYRQIAFVALDRAMSQTAINRSNMGVWAIGWNPYPSWNNNSQLDDMKVLSPGGYTFPGSYSGYMIQEFRDANNRWRHRRAQTENKALYVGLVKHRYRIFGQLINYVVFHLYELNNNAQLVPLWICDYSGRRLTVSITARDVNGNNITLNGSLSNSGHDVHRRDIIIVRGNDSQTLSEALSLGGVVTFTFNISERENRIAHGNFRVDADGFNLAVLELKKYEQYNEIW